MSGSLMSSSPYKRFPGNRVLLGVAAALVAVAIGLGIWWNRDQDPPEISQQLIKASLNRLHESIVKREEAQSKGEPNSQEAQEISRRIDRLKATLSETSVSSATVASEQKTTDSNADRSLQRKWLADVGQKQVQALIAAREELFRRGSAEAYRFEAEASWELDHMREIARRTGYPIDLIPENEFELLHHNKLLELQSLWTSNKERFEKVSASAPRDAFAKPLETANARLKRIKSALERPTVLLNALFEGVGTRGSKDPEFAKWIEESESVRAAEIAERDQQLLEKSKAIDGTDLGVLTRLASLEQGANIADSVLRTRSGLVMERARGFTPADARSAQIKELFAARFSDPIRATECEALLTLQFHELLGITDPDVRSKVLPNSLANSVLDWMVSQLTDGDLSEAKSRHAESEMWLARLDSANPTDADKKCVEYDRIVARLEGEAIDREIAYRTEHGQSRAGTYQASDLDIATRSLLEHHVKATTADLSASDEGLQSLWEAQRRYTARAAIPNPEVFESIRSLTTKRFESEIDRLETNLVRLKELAKESKWRNSGRIEDLRRAICENLTGQILRLQTGLGTITDDLGIRQSLASRLKGMESEVKDLTPPSQKSLDPAALIAAIDIAGPHLGGWEPPPNGPASAPGGPETSPNPAGGGKPPKPKQPDGGFFSPFADAALRSLSDSFRQKHGMLAAEIGTLSAMGNITSEVDESITLRTSEKPYVAFEHDLPGFVRKGSVGKRPELKVWEYVESDGRKVRPTFEQIDTLETFKVVPGGVAFGKTASVDGDWTKCGLVYIGRERRFVFISPEGKRMRLPLVDPVVLKTCILFVRSNDSVAVSIGRDAGVSQYAGRPDMEIRLSPELADTLVGRDIYEADRLPWSLKRDRLPNGAKNPVLAEMRDLVDEATKVSPSIVSELIRQTAEFDEPVDQISGQDSDRSRRFIEQAVREIGSSETFWGFMAKSVWAASPTPQARADKMIELLRADGKELKDESKLLADFESLPNDRNEAIKLIILSAIASSSDQEVPWSTLNAGCLVFAAGNKGEEATLQYSASIIPSLLRSDLSLLTDASVRFVNSGADLTYECDLEIRYVHNVIEQTFNGLRRTSEVEVHAAAGKKATELIPQLRESYPSLRRAQECAAWMAFVRWAFANGNVAWVDISDLKGIRHQTIKTPDYLIRGGQRDFEEAIKKYGLDPLSQ